LFIKLALGWDLYVSIFGLLGLTGICTITGGLAAVIYMEGIQALIMVVGGAILLGFAWYEIGSYEQLYIRYMSLKPNISTNSTLNHCGLPSKHAFQMLRSLSDKDMPWLGFLLGQTPASLWYWCSDQVKNIKFKFFLNNILIYFFKR
jgi:solute carrier family 5 (sodium/myo-inositol cotransporter), member 3